MSYTQNKTSSRSLREKARERFAHADERGQRAPGSNASSSGPTPPDPTFGFAPMLERVASYWWVELLLGVFWLVISVVVLKFNEASVTTVGILT
ncbi:MAG: hypothetical protein ACXVII_38640, partial [Solirubrobacteraceae bacterium]